MRQLHAIPMSRLAPILLCALLLGACSQTMRGFADPGPQRPTVGQLGPSPTYLLSMGDANRADGRLQQAARFYAAARRAKPNHARPVTKLAGTFHEMGKYKAAADSYRAALVLEPENLKAKRGLANALVAADTPKSALVHYRAIIAKSGDYRAFNGLGVALDMMGDHEAAQRAYVAGLKRRPDSLSLKNNLALSLAMAGRHKDARNLIGEVVAHPFATSRHRQNLALVNGMAHRARPSAGVTQNGMRRKHSERLSMHRKRTHSPRPNQQLALSGSRSIKATISPVDNVPRPPKPPPGSLQSPDNPYLEFPLLSVDALVRSGTADPYAPG